MTTYTAIDGTQLVLLRDGRVAEFEHRYTDAYAVYTLHKGRQRKKVRRHWERVWKEYDSEERRMDNFAQQYDSVSMKRKRWIVK